ncbi:COX15/CtaA family protein [Marinobacterium sp. A346]|uniref:COX15/CtaA family protein n=2 Tax=Marinobacterium weihaiense TaxID=2851016 RepID=A0ABS6MCB6_9GAMM|nr:COX15/CtaA family protein [Marinobacterium weihaiense]
MGWPLRLVRAAIGLALVVVLLGGWTRLNDAGLGCPDWPGCYGTWVLPQEASALATQHPHATVDLRKGWIEMVHRYAAATLGLMIMGLAVLALRRRHGSGYPVRLSLGLLVLVIAQGLFGMWTVTLKLLPAVVTLHLLGGLVTLSLLVMLHQQLVRLTCGETTRIVSHPWLKPVMAVLFLQLALGGWTSTNYAGWACTDWLWCHQDQATGYDFARGLNPVMSVGPNYEGGLLPADARAAIQVTHRAGAVLLLVVSFMAAWRLWSRVRLRGVLCLYIALLLLQAGLGIANVIWLLPLSLAVAHHAGAVALLLVLLELNSRAGVLPQEVKHGYAAAH